MSKRSPPWFTVFNTVSSQSFALRHKAEHGRGKAFYCYSEPLHQDVRTPR